MTALQRRRGGRGLPPAAPGFPAGLLFDAYPVSAYADAAGTTPAAAGGPVRRFGGATRVGTVVPATLSAAAPPAVVFAGPAQRGDGSGYALPSGLTVPLGDCTIAVVAAVAQAQTADGSSLFTLGDWGVGSNNLWCYVSGPYVNLRSQSGGWLHRWPLPEAGYGVLLVTLSGGKATFRMRAVSSTLRAAVSDWPNAAASAGGGLACLWAGGAPAGPYEPKAVVRRLQIYSPALSVSDQAALEVALCADAGLPAPARPAKVVACSGDSRTFGSNFSGQGSYPGQLGPLLPAGCLAANLGVFGATPPEMSVGPGLNADLFVGWCAFNSLNAGGAAAAAVVTQVAAATAAAKAAGAAQVVWLTEPSYPEAAAGDFESRRLAFNASLRANFAAMGLANYVDLADIVPAAGSSPHMPASQYLTVATRVAAVANPLLV